ncbi:NAC transcription factor 25-like [Telopea speciosissima]|uniref:NAC transcription factor 25-like n=1 Tax=Telopea speciosissima TaxID=54955 RepID=UPI001CC73EBB|nr:NAC transcription factor 25-like [Telopea speciosissima]
MNIYNCAENYGINGDNCEYFFTQRTRKYPNGSRPSRSAAGGFWKASGADKEVEGGNPKHIFGYKRSLVFYNGKPDSSKKTNWLMQEFRTAEDRNAPNKENERMKLDDEWVLCKIYKITRKRQREKDEEKDGEREEDISIPLLENGKGKDGQREEDISIPLQEEKGKAKDGEGELEEGIGINKDMSRFMDGEHDKELEQYIFDECLPLDVRKPYQSSYDLTYLNWNLTIPSDISSINNPPTNLNDVWNSCGYLFDDPLSYNSTQQANGSSSNINELHLSSDIVTNSNVNQNSAPMCTSPNADTLGISPEPLMLPMLPMSSQSCVQKEHRTSDDQHQEVKKKKKSPCSSN